MLCLVLGGACGGFLGVLRGPWGVPGGSLGVLGCSLGASKNSKKNIGFFSISRLGAILKETWGGLGGPGADLGGSCSLLGTDEEVHGTFVGGPGDPWGVPGGNRGSARSLPGGPGDPWPTLSRDRVGPKRAGNGGRGSLGG